MRVTVGGERYQIDWVHELLSEPRAISGTTALIKGYTMALAEKLDENNQPVGDGVLGGIAYCSAKDTFLKEKGRKISLTDLLAKWGLSKADRTAVWAAYRSRG